MFFKKEEKDLANRHSEDFLKIRYESTEKKLKAACKTGELKNIKKAMKNHHKYEYDENGRLLKENNFEEDLVSYITYEYDEAGNIVRENEFNGDNSVFGYWLRIAPFDAFGNPSTFEW